MGRIFLQDWNSFGWNEPGKLPQHHRRAPDAQAQRKAYPGSQAGGLERATCILWVELLAGLSVAWNQKAGPRWRGRDAPPAVDGDQCVIELGERGRQVIIEGPIHVICKTGDRLARTLSHVAGQHQFRGRAPVRLRQTQPVGEIDSKGIGRTLRSADLERTSRPCLARRDDMNMLTIGHMPAPRKPRNEVGRGTAALQNPGRDCMPIRVGQMQVRWQRQRRVDDTQTLGVIIALEPAHQPPGFCLGDRSGQHPTFAPDIVTDLRCAIVKGAVRPHGVRLSRARSIVLRTSRKIVFTSSGLMRDSSPFSALSS